MSTVVIENQREGIRIMRIRVSVSMERSWDDIVRQGCPDTPLNYAVWGVDYLFPAVPDDTVRDHDLVLVNFGHDTATFCKQALAWGEKERKRPAWSQHCLALAERKLFFNREIGFHAITVLSLRKCTIDGVDRVCYARWHGSRRFARLSWFDDPWLDDNWFAYEE